MWNLFLGFILEEFGNCVNLMFFDFFNNNFNGFLLKSIGNLVLLMYLSLFKNVDLGGDLLDEIGNFM